MALSKISRVHVDPAVLNDDLLQSGAFLKDTGQLNLDKAATVVGIAITPALQPDAPGLAGHLTQLSFDQASLLVRVDYEPADGDGNHTILLTSVTPDGTFHGIDPAGGFEIEMVFDANGNLVGHGSKEFRATSLRIVEARDDSDDLFGDPP